MLALRAIVPPAARGFVVKVDESEIIDLGTEFTLDVGTQDARVEVLDGEVEVRGGEGHSFAPLLNDPDLRWKKAAFSQYPNPALREWAANLLSQGMRETWFGPLIKDLEQRIIDQQGERWDRELFEQYLIGYTMRTDCYRLVVWRDRRVQNAEPLFFELFDHQKDPHETSNIAADQPELVRQLAKQMNAGWKATF